MAKIEEKLMFWKKKKIKEFKPQISNYRVPEIPEEIDISCKASFIFEQCEKYLINTIESNKKLQNKAMLILLFIFSLLFFAVFKALTSIIAAQQDFLISPIIYSKEILFWICVSLEYFLIGIPLVFLGFYPKQKALNGNEPKNMMFDEFISQPLSLMKIGEAATYQKRININKKTNKTLCRGIKISIILLYALPLGTLLLIFLRIVALKGF
jgi:hypothetical protein